MLSLPPWLLPIIFQIPLVVVVTWAFTRGWVHSDSEMNRIESDHAAELKRRDTDHQTQIAEWRRLYDQERTDRLAANERLAHAVDSIKDVVSGVDELTREVIRGK